MLTLIQRQFAIASKGSTLKGASRKWMDRHINDPYVKQAKIVRSFKNFVKMGLPL
jgi:hypothetical protein